MFISGTSDNWQDPSGTGTEAPAAGSGGGSGSSGASSGGATASTPAPAAPSTPSAPATAVAALQSAEAKLTAASSPAAPGTPDGTRVPVPTATATGVAGAPGSGQASPSAPAHVAPPQGPVPYDRHEAALRNARSEFNWIRETNLDQPAIMRYIELGRRLDADSTAFHRDLGMELNGAGSGQELDDLIDPEPDMVDQTGRIQAYSAEAGRQLAANAAERMRRQLMQELGPVVEHVRGQQTREEMAAIRHEGQQSASAIVDLMSRYKHWDLGKVGAIYRQLDPSIRKRFGTMGAMQIAYQRYVEEQVLPTLGARAQQEQLADLNRSAAAGTMGAPASAAVIAPTKPVIREGNVDDLAKSMAARYAAMNATA